MSKITKQDLQNQINRLYAADSTRHNQMLRMQRALSSLGVDIMSDEFDAPDSEPKLKVLDQSVFDGLDEKWRFAAVVEDGRALYFNKKPCGSDDITGHFVFKGDYQSSFCGNDYDASNWQNSLIERESELKGSDLCRAMLARGDKWVLCFVHEFSDDKAVLHEASAAIRGVSHRGFETDSNEWNHAVPINNMGEPLTAKDVGL